MATRGTWGAPRLPSSVRSEMIAAYQDSFQKGRRGKKEALALPPFPPPAPSRVRFSCPLPSPSLILLAPRARFLFCFLGNGAAPGWRGWAREKLLARSGGLWASVLPTPPPLPGSALLSVPLTPSALGSLFIYFCQRSFAFGNWWRSRQKPRFPRHKPFFF